MHLLKKRSMRFYMGFFLILTLSIGGSAIAAFADSPAPQVAVQGQTSVSEGTTAITPATSVTLDGSDHTATYSMVIPVSDDTGTGNGWYLTIYSTQFDTAGTNCQTTTGYHTLGTGASTIHTVTSTHNGAGTYTDPNNSKSSDLGIPSACPVPTAVTFYNDLPNYGMGDFKLTATVNVSIPANTIAGTYQSTVTLALISGQSPS